MSNVILAYLDGVLQMMGLCVCKSCGCFKRLASLRLLQVEVENAE
jgi:hypothetical protein